MARRFEISRGRLLLLAGVVIAGGSLASVAVARTLQASRRAEAAREGLKASSQQLTSLGDCSDAELERRAALRRPADLGRVNRLFGGMPACWRVTECPAGEGEKAWSLRAADLGIGKWPEILRELSGIDQIDGLRLVGISASASQGPGGEALLTIEARVSATLSLEKGAR